MGLVDNLVAFFRGPKEALEGTPEGLCPNCWGEQEYQGKVRELYEDRQVNVNNHDEHYAFVQDFVVKHVQGIHLQRHGGSLTCPRCGKSSS